MWEIVPSSLFRRVDSLRMPMPGLEEGSSGGEGTSANYVSFIPFDEWIGSAQVGLRWLGHSCVLIFSVL